MCGCVWLTIVVVCVCRLGEEHLLGCACLGEVGKRIIYVFCSDNLYYHIMD